jgi:hypothetical protein
MTGLRAPTMAELVVLIRVEPDERRRAQLEDWYWAKSVDTHGTFLTHWHRQEYDWLVARQARLERMLSRPALGAYRRSSLREAA